jgi:hypothetical protein
MTNWRNLQAGQRVRVTLDAEVQNVRPTYIHLGLPTGWLPKIRSEHADAATWEVIDPPLRVGPAEYRPAKKRCEVLALANGFAWVRYDTCGSYDTQPTHYFRNVSEGE